jgi:hypothetical protein
VPGRARTCLLRVGSSPYRTGWWTDLYDHRLSELSVGQGAADDSYRVGQAVFGVVIAPVGCGPGSFEQVNQGGPVGFRESERSDNSRLIANLRRSDHRAERGSTLATQRGKNRRGTVGDFLGGGVALLGRRPDSADCRFRPMSNVDRYGAGEPGPPTRGDINELAPERRLAPQHLGRPRAGRPAAAGGPPQRRRRVG